MLYLDCRLVRLRPCALDGLLCMVFSSRFVQRIRVEILPKHVLHSLHLAVARSALGNLQQPQHQAATAVDHKENVCSWEDLILWVVNTARLQGLFGNWFAFFPAECPDKARYLHVRSLTG